MSTPVGPPDNPFLTYEPSGAEPWDTRRVGHLLRRAAMGPSLDAVDALLKLSPAQAVDSLLNFDITQDALNAKLDGLDGFFTFKDIKDVQDWCFFRMAQSAHPAQERMALFWHNHFATSASKVDQSRYMHQQMELFRQMGLGSFRDLLKAVTHDPAMLVWLDGQSSRKGHPNENYGREVMELFTLGIGNYTEKDVQQIARAFTGWTIEGYGGKAVFNSKLWDDGDKTIFGTTGKYDSDMAIDLILKQPAAPKHLAAKILRGFVNPDPTPDQIAHVGMRLIFYDWQIKPVLKEIFTSRIFYSDWAYRSRIKSPIDLVVGAGVALGGTMNARSVTLETSRMGQNILFPPNVKGWDGNEAWINANTLLCRFNFGYAIATGRGGDFVHRPKLEDYMTAHGITTPETIVDHFAKRLLDGKIDPDARAKFVDFLNLGPDGKPLAVAQKSTNQNKTTQGHDYHDGHAARTREMIHLMMTVPEYQLA